MSSRFHNSLTFIIATLLLSLTASPASSVPGDSDSPGKLKRNLTPYPFPYDTRGNLVSLQGEKSVDQLFQQGVQQYRQGKYREAVETYQKVLEIRRQQNDKAGIGQTLNNLGEVYYWLRQHDQALEVLQPALAIRQELKDKAGEAETLDNIGFAYYFKNQNDKALETLQQALTIRQELKDKAGEAETLSNLGLLYAHGFKQYPKGLETLQQALAIHEEVGDKFQTGMTLRRIGRVYETMKDYAQALEWSEKALAVNREIGNFAGEGETLIALGDAYYYLENYDSFFELYQQALPKIQAAGIRPLEVSILFWMGNTYNLLYKGDKALDFFQKALPIAREIPNNKSQEADILSGIATAYFWQEKIDKSIEFLQQELAIQRETKDEAAQLQTLLRISQLYATQASSSVQRGLYSQAKTEFARLLKLAEEALIIAKKLEQPESEAQALNLLGYAHTFLDKQKAIDFFQQAIKIALEIKNLDIEDSALTHLASIAEDRQVVEIRLRQVEIARQQNKKWSEADALITLGSTYNVLGEHQKAVESFQQALAAAREIDIAKLAPNLQASALRKEFHALNGLTNSYSNLGEYDTATDFAQQALKKAQALQQPTLEVEALLKLGFLYYTIFNNYPKVIEVSQQALTIAQQIKEPSLEAKALESLSEGYNKQGNYAQALQSAEQALAIAKRLENSQLEQSILDSLGDIYENQGNYQKALEFAQARLAVVQKAKLNTFEINALVGISTRYLSVGDTTKAVEIAQQALTLARQTQNPARESLALNYLSRAYRVRGEYEQGIQAAADALQISRQNKDFIGEVEVAANLSQIYEVVGEYQKVIAVAEPGLAQARKLKKRAQEAQLLINLGNAYGIIGKHIQGKQLVEQGLTIARELKNRPLESEALARLSNRYSDLGEYQKSWDALHQSWKIAQEINLPAYQQLPLSMLGYAYSSLGDYQKSNEYYQQAISIVRQLKNRKNESLLLMNIAHNYFAQGNPQKTIEFAQQALVIAREIKDPRLEAYNTIVLSVGYGELGNDQKAIEAAQTFLDFARKVENPIFEKDALKLLASLHRKFGRKEQAIETYQQALAIKIDQQLNTANTIIYAGLGRIYRDLNQPDSAISYYKQSINAIEEFRRGIEGLPPELQSSVLQATVDFDKTTPETIYREYADLLLKQGRTLEAQQVLELLKFQEIKQYFGNARGTTINDQVIALGKELTELETIPRQQRTPPQQQRIIELRKLQEKISEEFGAFIQTPEIAQKVAELRQITGGENLDVEKQVRTLQDDLKRLQQDAVIIYPLVLPDRLELVLVTPYSPPIHRTIAVSSSELNTTIAAFRRDLENPLSNAQVNANKLYGWLIKPIEKELAEAKTKTIIYAPDGQLRYVPLAALHDGKQWLVQRFRINNITALSLTNLNTKPQEKLQVLGAAFADTNRSVPVKLGDEEVSFRGLKYAGREIENIAATIPGSTKLIDDQFNLDIVYQMNDYSVVHLATHAAFVDGLPDDSIIMFGNGKYVTLRDVQNWNLPNVDLVVLSACETGLGGFGDGKEILGFAYQMQLTKARAAIATLWSVDDGGTQALMDAFYAALQQPNTTKAEALKAAQIALITGDYQALGKERGIEVQARIRNNLPPKVQSYLSHPYYWAPFVLIGNGL